MIAENMFVDSGDKEGCQSLDKLLLLNAVNLRRSGSITSSSLSRFSARFSSFINNIQFVGSYCPAKSVDQMISRDAHQAFHFLQVSSGKKNDIDEMYCAANFTIRAASCSTCKRKYDFNVCFWLRALCNDWAMQCCVSKWTRHVLWQRAKAILFGLWECSTLLLSCEFGVFEYV